MSLKMQTIAAAVLLLPSLSLAEDVIVTRAFTGTWDQPEHESQGLNLTVIDQDDGVVRANAYWYTYGADRASAWFLGVGEVVGDRIGLVLYEGNDIGFLEDDSDGDARVVAVGSMEIEFSSCDAGFVSFETDVAGVGSGSFPIERITTLLNTQCSGGVSDDTPADVVPSEQRIALAPAREGITGSGHADFEERPDRTEFSVEAEGLADGEYRIFVGGEDRGPLTIALGVGETEFRSPVEAGKVLLTFDPREQLIEVQDDQGAVLTSGDGVIDGDDDVAPDIDFGTVDLEVALTNTGVFPAGSGDARLEPREDRTDFKVEIEDVPVGSYALRVGGEAVGTIEVRELADGSVEGEIEFRNPVEPGKVLLDFDPRGKVIEVLDGGTVIFTADFPAG